MSAAVIKALALNEVRLRMRRTSTLVVLLAVIALSWFMIADPSTGSALIVADGARVLYTSSTLSIGSASLGCILFGLGGFYLVRGRIAEDIRSGIGAVIGATPVGNALFLVSRWLGSVAYLCAMIFVFMLTIIVLHLLRGDGPVQPLIYLSNYVLLLLPMVVFTASCAMLFDGWAPLMGKGGDFLFFIVWSLLLGVIGPNIEGAKGVPFIELFDFNGIGASMLAVTQGVGTTKVALGGGEFDAALAPVTMGDAMWPIELLLMRAATTVLALAPLLIALFLFHRFSPDRVRISQAGKRRSPFEVVNTMLKPLSALTAPVFRLAARIGGFPGQVLGDVALTFAAAPMAILALGASVLVSAVVEAAFIPGVMMAAVTYWGVLVCDLSTRDHAADSEHMAAAVPGGAVRRFLRQYAATVLIGLMFGGVALVRWIDTEPLRAAALAAGVLSFSALATMFGRCSRTARLFQALFLFWAYVSLNAKGMPLLDAVGFLGDANATSIMTWLAAGALALAGGYAWNRRPV